MITTDRQIQALKPRESVYWQSVKSPHGGGLVIRVSKGGSRSWYIRYRIGGRQDAINIGAFPAMGLKEAREKHAEVRGVIEQGLNPKAVQRERKAANQAAWAMDQLFAEWIVSYASTPSIRTRRPPSEQVVEQTRWRWRYYLRDRLGSRLVRSIEPVDIKSAIITVANKQSREQARKCLSLLRSMFDYAEAHHQIATNPAQGIQPAKVGASKGAPRERYLSLPELRRLWVAIDETRLAASTATAIKLLILTGQRRGEVLLAKWEHIDLEQGIWTTPAANTKSWKAHTIYLPEIATDLLCSLTRENDFVFPGRVEGQPTGGQSLTTAIMRIQGRKTSKRDESAPMADVEPFSVHDLRRSMATGLGEHCAVPPHIVERMLNHASEDRLVDTYQRATYESEQRAAWKAWGELIASQVAREPGNVIPMVRTR